METTTTTCDPARAERSRDSSFYFLCDNCGATGFARTRSASCPRCAHTMHGGEQRLAPWNASYYRHEQEV